MSKCGLCGEDFGSKSHMVIECRANMIPKALYEKAAAWMADNEDSCLLEENMPKEDVDQYLLDEAFEIMNEIYQIYSASDGGSSIGRGRN